MGQDWDLVLAQWPGSPAYCFKQGHDVAGLAFWWQAGGCEAVGGQGAWGHCLEASTAGQAGGAGPSAWAVPWGRMQGSWRGQEGLPWGGGT